MDILKKKFYSIGEVAQIVNENISTLRYWEKVYPELQPKKSRKGTRLYTDKDIEYIKKIKFLLRDQKLTQQGTEASLKIKLEDTAIKTKLIDSLQFIRKELVDLHNRILNEKRKLLADREEDKEQ